MQTGASGFSGLDIQNHRYSIFSNVSGFDCTKVNEYKDQVADAGGFFTGIGAKVLDVQNGWNGKASAIAMALEVQGNPGNGLAEILLKLFCKELERLKNLEP